MKGIAPYLNRTYDCTEVREHVRRLMTDGEGPLECGMNQVEIGLAAGVNHGLLSKLLNGGSVSKETAERLLAVEYDRKNRANRSMLAVAMVRRLLNEGRSADWIAERAGLSKDTVLLYARESGIRRIHSETFEAIKKTVRDHVSEKNS